MGWAGGKRTRAWPKSRTPRRKSRRENASKKEGSRKKRSVRFFGRRCGIGRVNLLKSVRQRGRKFEVSNIFAGGSRGHKVQPDRKRGAGPRLFCAQRSLFVEAHPHATGHSRREAYEPGIGEIVGSAGFSGDRKRQL